MDGRGLENLGVPDDEIARILTPKPEVIAEGNWCMICQFLEDEDDIENDKCNSCGCEGGAHQHVKVVTA